MANYKLLKQLKVVVHLINDYPGITKINILERLLHDYDFDISSRTLDRHLRVLKLEFGLDIIYNNTARGYEISEDADQEQLAEFLKFAEFSSLAEFYAERLNDFETFKKVMLPEDNSTFKGLEHVTAIFSALKEGRFLSFKKSNYYKEGINDYEVIPLKIKEYKNRWYLIAGLKDEVDIRNFGLDRISKLQLGKHHKINLKPYNELIEAYNSIVGLNYSDFSAPLKVVLHVNPNQINYLKSLPLHHSQVIGRTLKNNWVEVSYFLKPNYELEVEILKLAGSAIVVEPKVLKDKITNHLKVMTANYQ